MSDAVLVAIFSGVGTLAGSIGGILASNKLTNFRLEKLEEKVGKHNNFDGRIIEVEARSKGNTRRIEALENKVDHLMEDKHND